MAVADLEQLVHIVQLDLRDTGLQELDLSFLSKLELLRCDRNLLSVLRVSGHALKSLHAAHNGTNVNVLCRASSGSAFVGASLTLCLCLQS